MIQIKFSNTGQAKLKRIQKLPEYFPAVMDSIRKGDAVKCINFFKDGIKKNEFGLFKLKKDTILAKKAYGYDLPEFPLYGKGEHDKKSYINCLRIQKLKNGWKIILRTAKHWKAGIELKTLFYVHEYGAIIKNKNGAIIIPPRPALFKAYKKTINMLMTNKRETSTTVKRAMADYINNGHLRLIEQIKKQGSGYTKYEEN